jgi:hypothetical protein
LYIFHDIVFVYEGRKKEEGRRKREEGRGKKEEGKRKKEKGRRKKRDSPADGFPDPGNCRKKEEARGKSSK